MIIDDLQSVENLLHIERACGRDYMSKVELDKIGSQLSLVRAILVEADKPFTDATNATIDGLARHPEAAKVVEMVDTFRHGREAALAAQGAATAPAPAVGCHHARQG